MRLCAPIEVMIHTRGCIAMDSVQPRDMEYRIMRLQARARKYKLTPGEKRSLQYCYEWIEKYYSVERGEV